VNAARAELFNRLADEICDPADVAALEQLLDADPAARRDYLAFMWVHAALHRDYAAAVDNDGNQPRRPRRGPPFTGWAAAILVAATAAIGLGAAAWRLGAAASAPIATVPIATVAKTRFLLVADESRPIVVGEHLGPGRLAILGGAVELHLRNGVTIVLQGPGEIDLVSDMQAFLPKGNAVVRVPKGMSGFRLDTSSAQVVDLGTEFAVRTIGAAATDVQVFDGEVIATAGSTTGTAYPVKLQAGQARRFATDATSAEIPYDERRFIRSISSVPGSLIERSPGGAELVHAPMSMSHILGWPKINEIVVHPAGRVEIDGRLDDWVDAPGFTATVAGADGTEWVDGRMMYDAERLYVAAHVGDPFPLRSVINPDTDPDRGWQGGSVQVRISTDRQLGWPAVGDSATFFRDRLAVPTAAELAAAANPRLAHLTMWHHAPTGRACLTIARGMQYERLAVNPAGFEGRFRLDADGRGYVLEYAIPWSLLEVGDDAPQSGDVLAAAWQVFWSDESGQMWREHVVEIRNLAEPPRVWVWERAVNWGRAIYR
jgi:ferric-dicitrate binding protein FerR (iron transport regulator)